MSDVLGPLDREPRSVRPPFARLDPDDPRQAMRANTSAATQAWRAEVRAYRVAAVREALRGVELGGYDERMIAWLAGLDVSSVGTVVSWLYRVRRAGRDETTHEE